MKIYIFMISMIGIGNPIILYAAEGPIELPAQMRSPQVKSLFSFLKRSSSRSSSMSSDRKSDIIIGSLDSTSSMQSSSSSLSVTSSQSSPSRAGNRLSRAISRLSMRRTHAPTIHEQEEGVDVEDEAKRKAESLEKELAERRRNLDKELDDAQGIIIPGVIQAAVNIFEQVGYESQSTAGIKNDPVADIKNTLGHLKNVLNNYLEAREEYAKKMDLNFERVGDFRPQGLYLYLGLTLQEGKSKSCNEIKAIIERKKAKATTNETQWMLRQTEYIFDNSESKRSYDAYLADQDDPLAKREKEHYWYLYKIVGLSCAAIEEAAHEYSKVLKEYQSQHDKSPDLSDQAFALDPIKN